MNPLILGILAVGGIMLIVLTQKEKEKDTAISRRPPGVFPVRMFNGPVPYAGFYGGSGGTIEEKPLLPY